MQKIKNPIRFLLFFILIAFVNTAFASKYYETIINGPIKIGTGNKTVQILEKAKKGDTVHIYLKTHGGSSDESHRIMEAMRVSKAKIIVEVVYFAFSGGALITLAADEVHLKKDTEVIFHMGQSQQLQKWTFKQLTPAHQKLELKREKIMRRLAPKLFTKEQWKAYFSGGDIFMVGWLYTKRLKRVKLITEATAMKPKSKIRTKAYKLRQLPSQFTRKATDESFK